MAIDLTSRYLGLELTSPLVASASPLTGNVESLVALHEAGAAAAVLPSLFEEQIEHAELELARLYDYQAEAVAESLSYFPEMESYNTGPERYLDLIRRAKQAVPIPIIASLNGASPGGWIYYGEQIEQAGADALELNIYAIPDSILHPSRDVESTYCRLVESLRKRLTIPLAVKIGPYFSSVPAMAKSLTDAGAEGLVLFNRYLAPDIDLENLEFKPSLELSRSSELRLALRWIAILRDQVSVSLAATGGGHTATDAAKAILVGADAVMMASTLLQHGAGHLRALKNELTEWLEKHQYVSVQQMKGSMSLNRCANPEGLLRSNYIQALTTYTSKL